MQLEKSSASGLYFSIKDSSRTLFPGDIFGLTVNFIELNAPSSIFIS